MVKCTPSFHPSTTPPHPPPHTQKQSNIISILVTFSLLKTHNRATVGSANLSNEYPEHGLVKDGTPCGDNLVCVNQTCVSIYPHIDQTKCPTNNMDLECFGHGVSKIFQK